MSFWHSLNHIVSIYNKNRPIPCTQRAYLLLLISISLILRLLSNHIFIKCLNIFLSFLLVLFILILIFIFGSSRCLLVLTLILFFLFWLLHICIQTQQILRCLESILDFIKFTAFLISFASTIFFFLFGFCFRFLCICDSCFLIVGFLFEFDTTFFVLFVFIFVKYV